MKTSRSLVLCVLLLVGVLHAEPDEVDVDILKLGKVAIEGNVDYPIRKLDQLRTQYPNEPRYARALAEMIARRAQVNGAEKPTGSPESDVAAGLRLPEISERTAQPGRDFTTETAGVAMVWVAPGKIFLSSVHGSDDDTLVTLSAGYWLGRTEVTQAQWQVLMENIPRPSRFKGANRPVESISWVSAMEFCQKLNERERAAGRLPAGYEYSLPTEAQWEHACRAGTTGNFAGDAAAMAWSLRESGEQSHPVGQKQPNAWGLYDMHGNVAEWCVDGYQGYPGGAVTDLRGDYLGPSAGTFRIVRGGGWASTTGECRSNFRLWNSLNTTNTALGFRLALVPVR